MKLCTVCGVVTSRSGSRCLEHARQSNRSCHNALYSTREWQHLSARVLRVWRGERGNWGFEQMVYELTPDAIELGLDAALPAVFELSCTIAEFGRGERSSGHTIQLSVRIEPQSEMNAPSYVRRATEIA